MRLGRALRRPPCAAPAARSRCRQAAQPVRAMLLEHLPVLANKRVVLASASPRRQELLQQMGLKFEVVVSSFEETLPKDQYSAADYARHTAMHKAVDVAQQLLAQSAAAAAAEGARRDSSNSSGGAGSAAVAVALPDLVIGADTVVEYGEHILEKPVDAADAARVLRMLSGKRHHVHTGVALVLPPAPAVATAAAAAAAEATDAAAPEPRVHSFSVTTSVEFDELSQAAVEAYIASGEPFGKAGSYGIQGLAGSFVRRIDGCYFNVVGFPLHRFGSELAALIQSGALQ